MTSFDQAILVWRIMLYSKAMNKESKGITITLIIITVFLIYRGKSLVLWEMCVIQHTFQ